MFKVIEYKNLANDSKTGYVIKLTVIAEFNGIINEFTLFRGSVLGKEKKLITEATLTPSQKIDVTNYLLKLWVMRQRIVDNTNRIKKLIK